MAAGWLALAGLGKSILIDQPKADRERKMQAEIAKYSPWTGMQANTNIAQPDPFGAAMQGYMAGKMMEQQNPAAKKNAMASSSAGAGSASMMAQEAPMPS